MYLEDIIFVKYLNLSNYQICNILDIKIIGLPMGILNWDILVVQW